jgi:hypothetical protein
MVAVIRRGSWIAVRTQSVQMNVFDSCGNFKGLLMTPPNSIGRSLRLSGMTKSSSKKNFTVTGQNAKRQRIVLSPLASKRNKGV